MIGTKTNYPDTGVRIHAGTQRFPHQYRRLLDSGSLSSTTCHCPGSCRHRCYLPHLEAQTR